MAVQSVDTLVKLGRPQSTHRADTSRISRVQIRLFSLCLLLMIGFGSICVFSKTFQQRFGIDGETGLAFPVTIGCSALTVVATAWGIRRLAVERGTHAIVHDNGVYIQTRKQSDAIRWEHIREIERVPINNATAIASGWLDFYFTWLLSNQDAESCLITRTDGSKVVLPSHLDDFETLARMLETRFPVA